MFASVSLHSTVLSLVSDLFSAILAKLLFYSVILLSCLLWYKFVRLWDYCSSPVLTSSTILCMDSSDDSLFYSPTQSSVPFVTLFGGTGERTWHLCVSLISGFNFKNLILFLFVVIIYNSGPKLAINFKFRFFFWFLLKKKQRRGNSRHREPAWSEREWRSVTLSDTEPPMKTRKHLTQW